MEADGEVGVVGGVEMSVWLQEALDIFGGRQSDFAKAIGESRQTVWHWVNRTGFIPADYAGVVEDATGIPCRAIVDEAHRRKEKGEG